MRCGLFAVGLICCVTLSTSAQTPPIDPAGINGALLLLGAGDVSEAALERFVAIAGNEKARIVVLAGRTTPAGMIDRLRACAKKANSVSVEVFKLKDPVDPMRQAIKSATGVWFIDWDIDIHDLLKGSRVVAASHGTEIARGDLLPTGVGPIAGGKLTADLRYQITPGAALLLQGRTISVVGEGFVNLSLVEVNSHPVRRITIAGKQQADLTALRRAALDRQQSFPPKKVGPPVLDKGTLIIVGGGGLPDKMFERMIDAAGGAGKAKIVIFPTAHPEPLPKRDALARIFRDHGAARATVLYGKTRAEVESKEFLDTLKEATGLWFDGGRQWRFVDCYENTKALPLMFDVLSRGGVIAGSSAGATIQGEYLCRGGVFDNFDIRYEGYERGLGFLKGVAIDQHFSQRKRHRDMTQLMKVYPHYLGIGLDEATAIVVKGQVAEVIGKGQAHFYDAQRKADKGQPDFEALPAGSRYDMKERKVLAR